VLGRFPALELLMRAQVQAGRLGAAAQALAALERAGDRLGTPYLLGRVRLAAGQLALARGDHEEARRASEDAIDRLADSAAPYDTAVARVELARALGALRRPEGAAAEARAARDAFAALGAARELERAEALLAGGPAAAADPLGELSAREVEVLGLVAQGLGDAGIAQRLYLSPHTVHRHVANVRMKLRLPSRTAAVAYAARAGLL